MGCFTSRQKEGPTADDLDALLKVLQQQYDILKLFRASDSAVLLAWPAKADEIFPVDEFVPKVFNLFEPWVWKEKSLLGIAAALVYGTVANIHNKHLSNIGYQQLTREWATGAATGVGNMVGPLVPLDIGVAVSGLGNALADVWLKKKQAGDLKDSKELTEGLRRIELAFADRIRTLENGGSVPQFFNVHKIPLPAEFKVEEFQEQAMMAFAIITNIAIKDPGLPNLNTVPAAQENVANTGPIYEKLEDADIEVDNINMTAPSNNTYRNIKHSAINTDNVNATEQARTFGPDNAVYSDIRSSRVGVGNIFTNVTDISQLQALRQPRDRFTRPGN